MIKITIYAEGNRVYDEIEKRETTLIENSLALRRLEEAKLTLLSLDYESDYEEIEGGDEDE